VQPVNDFAADMTADACVPGTSVPKGSVSRLAILLVRLGNQLSTIADGRLADSGLDERDYIVLAILAVDGPGSQHELSALLGKAPGVVVAAVDQLESKGFVERNRDPQDRRRSRVTITAAGERALARADELAAAAVADVLYGLSPGELDQLHELVRRGLAG
jgi:DNA-binding MarR family transcriptional regulator